VNRHVLLGPFLTRREAAQRARLPVRFLEHRHDLLRLGGRRLPEVYPAFQFDDAGVSPNVARVVARLKECHGDLEICEWLTCPQPELGDATPLDFLLTGHSPEVVLAAAAIAGPVAHDAEPAPPPVSRLPGGEGSPPPAASHPSSRRRYPVFGAGVAHPAH